MRGAIHLAHAALADLVAQRVLAELPGFEDFLPQARELSLGAPVQLDDQDRNSSHTQ